jgi:hypothetical protein
LAPASAAGERGDREGGEGMARRPRMAAPPGPAHHPPSLPPISIASRGACSASR